MACKKLTFQYKSELLNNVIPFWEKHLKEAESDNYFTCLDCKGSIFDTDKFIWLKGREVWTYATLYDKVEKKPQWLEMAEHGVDLSLRLNQPERAEKAVKIVMCALEYALDNEHEGIFYFVDKEYYEWFGYLNHRGEELLPLKGGKWKGCFHVL